MEITVAIKKPLQPARRERIENSLEAFQRAVGGYIEVLSLAEDLVIVCNEEGLIKGLPYNCNICGEDFRGDIVICGAADGEFTDIPCDWEVLRAFLPRLFESYGLRLGDVVSKQEFNDCRNELCLKCGRYSDAHNGACMGCRWRDVK